MTMTDRRDPAGRRLRRLTDIWGPKTEPNVVRTAREERQLSLTELANAAGVDKAHLSGVERGRGNLGFDKKVAVAATLRLPVEALWGSDRQALLDALPALLSAHPTRRRRDG